MARMRVRMRTASFVFAGVMMVTNTQMVHADHVGEEANNGDGVGGVGLGFASSYGSHMVLQRAPSNAVVWGHCGSSSSSGNSSHRESLIRYHDHDGDGDGCNVKLTVTPQDGEELVVNAKRGGPAGTWIAKLPPVVGGSTPHTITATDGTSSISLTDVLFGDVWVCSGQSNMAFLLENAFNGSELVKDADNHPMIRLFTSKKLSSNKPLDEQPAVEEAWTVSNRTTVTDDGCPKCNAEDGLGLVILHCNATGVHVHQSTGLPVGLVNTNWGGTPVEFWMSNEAEAECPDPKPAGGAYNGMIKPLLNMTIFGSIWYQGEANIGDALTVTDPQGLPMASYGCRFPAMIQDWRKKWFEGTMGSTAPEFPFGFVSLGPWVNKDNGPAVIRWAQTAGYGHVPNEAMPNVFDAIAFDLTDRGSPVRLVTAVTFGSVHIRDKVTVGNRLAMGGLSIAYNQTGTYWQGPVAEYASGTSKSIEVEFSNSGASGLTLMNNSGFETCVLQSSSSGSNCSSDDAGTGPGQWAPATATDSSSNTISVVPSLVDHLSAEQIVLIRYGWASLPFEYKQASIYSKEENLPAGPFLLVVKSKKASSE